MLTSFGQDIKIPAYGFGAQASSAGPLPYMFALDSEGGQLELDNVDVSIACQQAVFNHVYLSTSIYPDSF